jgi:uncharacterized RDD family membrane protein YckC
MGQQFGNLIFTLIVVFFVHRHYKNSTYASTDLYATFWPRFWSAWCDSLVLWPIGFVSFLVLITPSTPKAVEMLVAVIGCAISTAYTILMLAHNGQTVGKRMTRIRVIDFKTEGKIILWQSLLRESIPVVLGIGMLGHNLYSIVTRSESQTAMEAIQIAVTGSQFWLFASIPMLWFLVEIITMLTNEKRRALHDYIAGTVVVRINTDSVTVA